MIQFIYIHLFKETINQFLIKKGYSENNIYHLISNKNVLINDKVVTSKNDTTPWFLSTITVTLNDELSTLPINKTKIDIVYEDDYLLIVNKPYNLDIEPTKANYIDNLSAMINDYFINHNIKSKIHLVNRLDKLTSGLVIVAKNQYIHNLFAKTKINKRYYALVEGNINNSGTIKVNLKKDENSIKRIVAEDGKPCITKYKKISYQQGFSMADVKILTGRTHQIRVSFAHINHPLVSDPLYNEKQTDNLHMYLHAYYVSFFHPITKKHMKIKIDK